ncbi:tetratricopeptide repeat protein [Acidobacteria bacterium AH-259-D05]|nr:tetratricopeptide repeat protein [Acidobacteria bacterium AH-259-D05]
MKKATCILWAVLALTAVIRAQADQDIAAKVLSVQGRVEVEQSPWASARIDQFLYPGNRIRTGPRSRVALLLADETQLKVSENSVLQLSAVRQTSDLLTRVTAGPGADQSILNISRGRAWLRSKKKPAPVQVRTPAVTAAIRGTEFDIRVADDGETFTTVLEGSIDFFNDLGSIVVNPGEQGRCRVGEAPTKTVILNPEDAVQWTLFYSAAVSPRDYPFIYASPEQALANLDSSGATPLRLAQIQHDAGNLVAALELLEEVSSAEGAETRGWIYLEQNRIGEAMEEFNGAPAQSPRTRLGFSVGHYRVNELEEAYQYVQDPGSEGRLKIQKAMLDLLTGNVEDAQSILESISSDEPAYSMGQGLLSNVSLAQNDKEQALAAAQRSVQANPSSPSAHLNLSLVQQSFFDLPEATRSVERALELDPHFLQAQVQYAKLLFGAGQTGKAEEVIRQALADAPQEAAVHSTLGFVLLARGETSEARVYFDRSIRLDNTRGEPHLGLGIADMREGRRAGAVLEMLQATTLEPQLALYQSYLGKAFYEERKFEQAFTALEAAMELDPRDPTPYLYSGIFQEDLNRPGAAVEDFQQSIRLNDNRAVYRSRFILDEDRATRNIKLANAFNRLGLTEWANLEAIKSYTSDPTNSSTRIFLADTFLNLDGRTTAGGSELLMARLLLPVNANTFNAFNDYTTLFERPRLNFTSQGTAGNLDTFSGSLIASGGLPRFAFGSIFTREISDGWRPVNDDSRSYTSVNLFKFAPTPHSDLLFTVSHTQTRQGDRGLGTPFVTPDNDPDNRTFTRTNRAEIGYHQQFHPGSELVVYFSGRTVDQVIDNPNFLRVFRGTVPADLRRSTRNPNITFQASHLLKVSDFQFKYGFDIFEGRSRTRDVLGFCVSGPPEEGCAFPSNPPPEFEHQEFDLDRQKVRFKTVFVQGDYVVSPKLIFTAGLNYDWANDNNTFDDEQVSMNRWNPQAGFLFSPLEDTTFRFAFMKTLQTHVQERLVPTHLFGFVLSSNEFQLSRSTGFHLGWDQRMFGGKTFIRTIAFWKDRTVPIVQSGDAIDFDGDFYGGRFVLNQFVTDRLTFVADYAITRDLNFFGLRHDHDVRAAVFYIHPEGYSFKIEEEYLDQSRHFVVADTTNVWTTNISLSFEMPQKFGLASLEVKNLFDRRYNFLADPLALDPRVPRRQLKFQLNFFF